MKRGAWIIVALCMCLLALLPGCRQPTGNSSEEASSKVISDGAHQGTESHFFFLPPMVEQPSFSGVLDTTLAPLVRIVNIDTGVAVASYAMGQGTSGLHLEGDHFQVDWNTADSALQPDQTYRIQILVPAGDCLILVGYADLDVVESGKEFRNVNTQQYIPLLDGRTLPIKFRIEQGARIHPPTAAISVAPSEGPVPLAVRFDGSASADADGDTLLYTWDFGDGGTGTGAKVEHVYTKAGSYLASLAVTDGRGGMGICRQSIVAIPSYTVTYDPNGATGGTVPVDRGRYIEGQAVTILDNTGGLYRRGFKFDGWNDAADGSGMTYAPQQTLRMGSADSTLFARWKELTYSLVTFGRNCSSLSPTVPLIKRQGEATTIAVQPADGYHFTGWSVVSNGAPVTIADPALATTTVSAMSGTVVLVANCVRNTCQLTVDDQAPMTVPEGVPVWIRFRKGEGMFRGRFVGWTLQTGEATIEDPQNGLTRVTPYSDVTITGTAVYDSPPRPPVETLPPGSLFDPDPVAVGYIDPGWLMPAGYLPPELGDLKCDHSYSYIASPVWNIVRYEWMFELPTSDIVGVFTAFYACAWPWNPGYSPDGKAFWTTSLSDAPTHAFRVPGTYTVVLRVQTNYNPPKANYQIFPPIVVRRPDDSAPAIEPIPPLVTSQGEDLSLAAMVTDIDQSWDPAESISTRWILPQSGYDASTALGRTHAIEILPSATGTLGWQDLSRLANLPIEPQNQVIHLGLEAVDHYGKGSYEDTIVVISE